MHRLNKVHPNQEGFTLVELLVVLAILALLVGLVVPNFFAVTEDSQSIMIQGQHEKMREAVFQYYADTREFPMEWSENAVADNKEQHQLWTNADDSGNTSPGVNGWDGPYIDRPILQENAWGGYWGVVNDETLAGLDGNYTVLRYEKVPDKVCEDIDRDMDDGNATTGAVQYASTGTDQNTLTVPVARQ
ncbi:MAG: prepilin-type N-terminal cleavage/methylation domain-containing protein [Chloroflexota bacterium]